jgi:hypothetical protein
VASAHTESEPRPGRRQYAQDLWLEAFVLFNFLCLTGDILLAHAANSFRNRAILGFLGLAVYNQQTEEAS